MAGWTAGFLAAIAMYFQVSAARNTDRRLVLEVADIAHLPCAADHFDRRLCLLLGCRPTKRNGEGKPAPSIRFMQQI